MPTLCLKNLINMILHPPSMFPYLFGCELISKLLNHCPKDIKRILWWRNIHYIWRPAKEVQWDLDLVKMAGAQGLWSWAHDRHLCNCTLVTGSPISNNKYLSILLLLNNVQKGLPGSDPHSEHIESTSLLLAGGFCCFQDKIQMSCNPFQL